MRHRKMTPGRVRTIRHRMNLAFAVILASLAAASIVPAMKLLTAYADYRTRSRRDAVEISIGSLPACVTVTVYYPWAAPEDPRLLDPVTKKDLDFTISEEYPGELSLSVDLKGDARPSVLLSLKPGDSHKLDYSVQERPSRTHISHDEKLETDPYGHLWISFAASAPYAAEKGCPVHAKVSLTGKMREPTLWEDDLPEDGTGSVDITAILEERSLNMLGGEKVLVSFTALMGEDGTPAMSGSAILDPERPEDPPKDGSDSLLVP